MTTKKTSELEAILAPGSEFAKYTKAILAITGSVFGVLAAALTDHHVSTAEAVQVGIMLVTAVGVYLVPNLPANPFTARLKLVVAAAGTALTALVPFAANGWHQIAPADWILVIIAGITALGVHVLPNKTD